MSWGAIAGAGIMAVGGLISSNQKAQAAKGAANAQSSANKAALAEEQRQFDLQYQEYQRKQAMLEQQNQQIRTNLAPYIQAGQGALFEMMALSGVAIPQQASVPVQFNQPQVSQIDQNKMISAPQATEKEGTRSILSGVSDVAGTVLKPGATGTLAQAAPSAATQMAATQVASSPYAGMSGQQAQQTAIENIASSPILQELTRQGEEAILQNAAATGGLRGGNVQGLLARYRPQMLQDEIDKQYSRLAGISGMGQSAISQMPTVASVGQAPTSNAAQYLSAAGDINAQRILSEAEAQGEAWGAVGKGLGTAAGAYLNQ